MLPLLAGQGKRPELCWRGNLSARDVGVRVRPPPRLPPPFQRQEGKDRQKLKAGPGRAGPLCLAVFRDYSWQGSTREEPLASLEGGRGRGIEPKAAAAGFLSGETETWVSPRAWSAWIFSGALQRCPAGQKNLPCAPPPNCGARPSQTVNSTSDLRCRRNMDQVGFSRSSVDCEILEELTASSPK